MNWSYADVTDRAVVSCANFVRQVVEARSASIKDSYGHLATAEEMQTAVSDRALFEDVARVLREFIAYAHDTWDVRVDE